MTMKRWALAWLAWPVMAFAQVPPTQTYPAPGAAPLPPLQQQWQQDGTDPTLSPNAPDVPETAPGMAPAAPPATGPATFARPNVWMPAREARLQALDKTDAQATDLTVRVGQTATLGSLSITVKACVVRPPDQPADAAAYLDVTDSRDASGGFNGWMLRNEPSVSMMQSPIYDLRVTGCA